MAGGLCFKGETVSLGSSAIDIIADYLRPYISDVSMEVMETVYEVFDYFQFLDFTKLSSREYMCCYEQIEKAIEIDLKANPVINNRPQDWIFKAWYEEIKPKMQASSLYDPNMLDK
ncbi:hypothetical protein [Pectobacterium punjabense]|uniref:hypothetical protein n=1 Tax=Pectobacterium punjabense TaxID=2108399 RepID=UPI001BFF0F7A|nr:hypothetical protein [Pectobacterium punjabense]MBT9183205.1 hypothetical protein [Pectobacterium punjabense]MDG0795525.1 hypothetical protein [Pectobacterium punjabense]GKW12782.1 hypothetical protein PEC301899_30640 [Pectobacterium carotovorum subsp. carotovorum]